MLRAGIAYAAGRWVKGNDAVEMAFYQRPMLSVWARNRMVKGSLDLGMVRLQNVRAELSRWRTLERSGSSRLAAIRLKA